MSPRYSCFRQIYCFHQSLRFRLKVGGTLDHLDVKLDGNVGHEIDRRKGENLEVLIDYRMVQTMDDL